MFTSLILRHLSLQQLRVCVCVFCLLSFATVNYVNRDVDFGNFKPFSLILAINLNNNSIIFKYCNKNHMTARARIWHSTQIIKQLYIWHMDKWFCHFNCQIIISIIRHIWGFFHLDRYQPNFKPKKSQCTQLKLLITFIYWLQIYIWRNSCYLKVFHVWFYNLMNKILEFLTEQIIYIWLTIA